MSWFGILTDRVRTNYLNSKKVKAIVSVPTVHCRSRKHLFRIVVADKTGFQLCLEDTETHFLPLSCRHENQVFNLWEGFPRRPEDDLIQQDFELSYELG